MGSALDNDLQVKSNEISENQRVIWNDIYISGTGRFIPSMRPINDIQVDGVPNDHTIVQSDYISFTEADEPATVMATRAATEALTTSELVSADVGVLIYAAIIGDAHHFAPVCHVQRVLRAPDALAFELSAASNGGTQGIAVAANLMTADASVKAALVCTAYRHPIDIISRWSSGMVFGDGAAAAVLSRDGGMVRLISGYHGSLPELEVLARNRSNERLGFVLPDVGLGKYLTAIARMYQAVIAQVLEEAQTSIAEIDYFGLIGIGIPSLTATILEPNGIPVNKTSWGLLRQMGHVGACDPLLSLNHLFEQNVLKRGDKVLLLGGGVGYRLTCIVAEIAMNPGVPGHSTS
ncbi:ketoacyl-ACP synthase III family protein [Mycobacterium ulcerans]|uniref:Ketoacyl-ACP synthase III family protein n=3 Tax=Mycobacterium ulcerans TaxID=1809 RepID=A0ABY5TSM5_MYCUL|nr:ketoacyl-ACP synthase III family protein [Mycobacterium ulcerans]MEB3907043.1 ketoacyl-ACP synthase III family protein [Mycobacterium ulcerans]MEB3911298.1 ketoacyl-ACP synthase III family protein [Mycobacterium ulcerans]MEB3921521.1 ketoacyl-ACP synthase III family protein [Mycobacterium ulcerans]MEB3925671.1 ketoacyl-ACP synthase III family protein [Mycobacterium ulcerans]MEB3929690.1 ketoacyl-ACP synthase III family protein [Mycobacterium ulcerans]